MTHPEKTLFKHAVKSYNDSDGGKNASARNKFVLAMLGFLSYSGAEYVRVTLRGNFGRAGVDMRKIWICFFSFLGLAYAGFSYGAETYEFGAGLFLLLAGIIGVFMGYWHKFRSKDDSDYKGDYGNRKSKDYPDEHKYFENPYNGTAMYLEPILYIIAGIIFCFYSLLLGIPIIFCGLSVWLEIVCSELFAPATPGVELEKRNAEIRPEEEFSEVAVD